MLDSVVNHAKVVLIYGTNVHNGVREMLRRFSTHTIFCEGYSAQIKDSESYVILLPDDGVRAPSQQPNVRLWYYMHDYSVPEELPNDIATVYVNDGRITVVTAPTGSFVSETAEDLGRWYTYVIELANDCLFRFSFQSCGLLMCQFYEFAKMSNVTLIPESLVPHFEALCDLFIKHPYKTNDYWRHVDAILASDDFLHFLHVFFPGDFNTLQELRTCRHLINWR